MKDAKKKIYWINSDRFDLKPDKSTYLESGQMLIKNNFDLFLLTGYKLKPYISTKHEIKIISFRANQASGFFRLHLLLKIFFWLQKRVSCYDILIVDAESLVFGAILKSIKGCFLQLDFRTIPTQRKTLKCRIDETIVWSIFLRLFNRYASGYSFNTESMREELIRRFKLSSDDYVICPSGVNTDLFRPQKTVKEKKFVLIYHGTVSYEKGLREVILSLLKLKSEVKENLIFRIYGSGLDFDLLADLAKKLGLSKIVEFRSLVAYDKISLEISKADAGICPFPDKAIWRTASPLKVFEYLSCAKVVIATQISSNKRILKNFPYVIWIKGFHPEDFARAIEEAYTRRGELEKLGAKGRDFALSNCTWEKSGNNLAEYLRVSCK